MASARRPRASADKPKLPGTGAISYRLQRSNRANGCKKRGLPRQMRADGQKEYRADGDHGAMGQAYGLRMLDVQLRLVQVRPVSACHLAHDESQAAKPAREH